MRDIVDIEKYPLDKPDSPGYKALVERCKSDLAKYGTFSLEGFLKADACQACITEISPVMASESFTHKRLHNIYFLDSVEGVDPDHPALNKRETVNHTVCADQIEHSVIISVYEYPSLREFLARTMGKPELYLMDDPLARANVMAYGEGDALNWHFDRSEFTTTLLLQSPRSGGVFEYRTKLRSDNDPNYDGVAKLLANNDPDKKVLDLQPGALNVFRGKNTAHRLTPVNGNRDRLIAVFSYYEFPGKVFSAEERLGFYGRTG
jgi:hypothetical protein